MGRLLYALIGLALFTGTVRADDESAVVQIHRLKTDFAVKIAAEGLAACRKQGVNIAIAVVDRGGHIQALVRDTLASPITVTIATHKANAAVNFNVPTAELEGRFTSPFSPGKIDGIVLSAGGLPINAGGHIIGGIGVSGAPSGETDQACAQAGLDSVIEELEFSF